MECPLAKAAEAETRLQNEPGSTASLDGTQRQRLMDLGGDLKKLWDDPAAPVELKKRILRTVINEVVAEINHDTGFIDLHIHWAGGVHSALRVRKNKSGINKCAASEGTVNLITELAKGWSDRHIAGILNRIGCKTGLGNSWSENRARSFRGQHNIPVFAAGSQRPRLTMQETAKEPNVSVAAVRTMVRAGKLPARQIAKGVPWMIDRDDLKLPAVTTHLSNREKQIGRPLEDDLQIQMPCL